MHVGIIDGIVIILYMIGTILIGLYFKKRISSADDFIVADRGLGMSVFIATMVATSIGGGSLIGYVGEIHDGGLVFLPSEIVFLAIQLGIALILAEKVRNFAGYTAIDVLGRNYGKGPQLFGGICSMIYMLGTGPAMQSLALGSIISLFTGLPVQIGAIISIVIIILYTYFSGMWGVAMTDYFQFVIMAVGIVILSFMVLNQCGGWENIAQATPAKNFNISADITTMIELIFVTAIPALIDGNRYQRFYAAKDVKVAKKGSLIAVIPWTCISILTFLLGFAAVKLVPDGIAQDMVMPTIIMEILPIGIKGIVIAALISAIMSTADSYLLVGATNFTMDIYKPFINPNATDKQILKVTKTMVIVLGLGGLALALLVPSIMGVWTIVSSVYVGGCFVPMIYALFFKGRKSNLAAMVTMIVGSIASIIMKVANLNILGLPPVLVCVIASIVIFIPLTLLDKNSRRDISC
ncbi:sodium:solute symporter [Ihubacter sp. mB4P-1]|uniref:sodium:solute symporter family protein n=1 Tax=Ihubacter sp. mB4P-1 TaxID=3242370 RepID=UPI00137B1B1F